MGDVGGFNGSGQQPQNVEEIVRKLEEMRQRCAELQQEFLKNLDDRTGAERKAVNLVSEMYESQKRRYESDLKDLRQIVREKKLGKEQLESARSAILSRSESLEQGMKQLKRQLEESKRDVEIQLQSFQKLLAVKENILKDFDTKLNGSEEFLKTLTNEVVQLLVQNEPLEQPQIQAVSSENQIQLPAVVDGPGPAPAPAGDLLEDALIVLEDVTQRLTELSSNSTSSINVSRSRSPSPCGSSAAESTNKVPRYELCLNVNFECEISCDDSPSAFWIRAMPCISETIEQDLMDRLRQMSHAVRLLQQPKLYEYCAAPCESGYRRGRILDFRANPAGRRFAKVLYIDHGTTIWIASDVLCVLPNVMYFYQWQAALCRLHGVEPANCKWSRAVVEKFQEFCRSEDLYLIAMDTEIPRNKSYTVQLYRKWVEEDQERNENLSEVLLNQFKETLVPSVAVPAGRFSCEPAENGNNRSDVLENLEQWQLQFDYLNFAEPYDEEETENGEEEEEAGNFQSSTQQSYVYVSGRKQPSVKRCYNVPLVNFKEKYDSNDFLHFNVNRVVNPDTIYITPISSDTAAYRREVEEFRDFTNELTSFYSIKENCIPIDNRTAQEHPYAVAQLSDDDGGSSFFRCRITESQHLSNRSNRPLGIVTDVRQDLKLTVFFIDLGREETMKPALEVFLLDERFGYYPARVWPCGLFATRPLTEGTSSGFLHWTPEAISAFKQLLKFDGPMKATVLLEETDRIGIVIYDYDKFNQAVIVNHELLKLGFARSDIKWVSYMAEKIDTLNSLMAATRRRFNKEVITENYVEAVLNAAGPSSPRAAPVFPDRGCRNYITAPEPGSTVSVHIHCMHSCVRFSVTFPDGTVDIRRKKYDAALNQESMKPICLFEHYRAKINEPRYIAQLPKFTSLPSINDYCLAKFSDDENLYRARILQFNEEDLDFQVKYVDYGNSEWVRIDNLFPITDDSLLAVPFMSLECRLANVRAKEAADLTENMNVLWESICNKPQKVRVDDVVQRENEQPLLLVELKVMDSDGSYIDINEFVVKRGWAEPV